MKAFKGNKVFFWISVLGCLISVTGLLWILFPSPQKTVHTSYSFTSPALEEHIFNVEVSMPTMAFEGRDEEISMRVFGVPASSNMVYIARLDLPIKIIPAGEVIEVSGENGEAMFYWRISPEREKTVSGRLWIYLLQNTSGLGKSALIGAFPIFIEFPWWTRGWIGLISGVLLLFSLIGFIFSRR